MLFKVELKINGEHYKTLALAKPLSIKKIIEDIDLESCQIMTCKIDYEYAKLNDIISDDVRLDCICTNSSEGYLIYQNTLIFVMVKAFYNLFTQNLKFVIEHSVGAGVFGEVFEGYIITAEDVKKLKTEMQKIIKLKLPIEKLTVSPIEAEKIFNKLNRDDVIKNLKFENIDIYKCEDYYDYFLSELADNTGILKNFDIVFHAPGIILRFPERESLEINGNFSFPRKLFSAHQEHDKWLNILQVHNVNSLNRAGNDYKLTELIQIEEALHEKKIVDFANQISHNNDVKIILIAGPTSSGKTSFAKRLSIQLRVNGIFPELIEMDHYFLPRHLSPQKENGEYDFEALNAIDLDLLNADLQSVLKGKEVRIPKFNFITGKSEKSYQKIKLDKNEILIFEGIHGLNDNLTFSVPFNQKIKIYVSALNNLNIDAHNRIPTTDSRKFRRIIRDYNFRGYSAEQTLERWDSIRAGEGENIYPFQENADMMFNSTLTYELGVLKKYIVPLLQDISKYSSVYLEAKRLLKMLSHFSNIPDDLVPSNSILREFIGGSIFKY